MPAAQPYKEGKITFSEAAHRAGLTLWDMQHYRPLRYLVY